MNTANSATGHASRLEILAPAGSPEALIAAIRGGADAVYLGAGNFNARRNAHNFDAAALREAAALCHCHGVRLYLTLNTLIRQEEMDDAFALAGQACDFGVDALIVQDTGLARRLHAAAPSLPLHASTQLSCHTPSGVRELVSMGFTRVVLAREMSRDEIAACARQGAELEVFVHGALCMCVSGQCYVSAMLGGRSGNRGLCAQPCRLPFVPSKGDCRPRADETALSLRDLSLYEYVGDMASLGVCSLKIEGRMKRPEYVAGAAACFSAARDAAYDPEQPGPDEQLLQDFRSAFSRSGFTDGYYTAHVDADMFGTRTKEDVTASAPALTRLARLYDREVPRVPVQLFFTMQKGQAVALTAADEAGHVVTHYGDVPEAAIHRPLDAERIISQLSKTGGTPFIAEVYPTVDDGLSLPLSSLNALRREVLDELLAQRGQAAPLPFDCSAMPSAVNLPPLFLKKQGNRPFLVARFACLDQIPEPFTADAIILPLSAPAEVLRRYAQTVPTAVEIPRGLFGTEESVARQLQAVSHAGVTAALCGNIGAFPLARQAGMAVIAGFGMNITNSDSLDAMAAHGVSAAVLSQELTVRQMRFAEQAALPVGMLAYGRQPLMLMRNCPYKAASSCAACRKQGALTDRMGMQFPVACANGCTELLNSQPLWLADKLNALPSLDFLLLHFTDESAKTVSGVIAAYRQGGTPPASFTRGLYFRGVE